MDKAGPDQSLIQSLRKDFKKERRNSNRREKRAVKKAAAAAELVSSGDDSHDQQAERRHAGKLRQRRSRTIRKHKQVRSKPGSHDLC